MDNPELPPPDAVRAVILGTIFSSFLYGLQSLAFFQYSFKFSRDRLFFQVLVILLLASSTVSWILGVYSSWEAFTPNPPLETLWRIEIMLGVLTYFSALLSQLFFGWRILNLGPINKWCIPPFLLFMMFPIIIGMIGLLNVKRREEIPANDWRMTCLQLALWSDVIINVILTTVLVRRLLKDFNTIYNFNPKSGTMLVRIAIIAFATGLVSTLFTMIAAILDLALPASNSNFGTMAFVYPQAYSAIVLLSVILRSDSEGWKEAPENGGEESESEANNFEEDVSSPSTNAGRVDPFPLGEARTISFDFPRSLPPNQDQKRTIRGPRDRSFDYSEVDEGEDDLDEKDEFLLAGEHYDLKEERQGMRRPLPPDPMSRSGRKR